MRGVIAMSGVVRFALLSLTALVAMGAVGAVVAATPAEGAPPQPQVHWSPCGDGFECAVANVPLDHTGDDGGTIQLSLIRRPADDQDARRGSLFVNPGGPGGSGVDLVRVSGDAFPAEVREHYDLVGFDPRGIARSTPVRCFGALRQAQETQAPMPFPVSEDEQAQWEASDREVADACDQRARRIMDHMSTADVARDLDVLREAVGDDELNFVGLSYGSYLGVTYANLFPERVGRVVVDGVLDPVAWATGRGDAAEDEPFTTRLDSHVGAQDTLEEFFALCDAAALDPDSPQPCPFGPDSANRFAALADALRAEPVEVPLGDGTTQEFSYAVLVDQALGAMYEPASWPGLAGLFASLEGVVASPGDVDAAAEAGAAFESMELVTKRGAPAYPNFVEGFPGVACADSDNPEDYAAWSQAAADADAESYFGSSWTWTSSLCQKWPGEGDTRYAGPWDADTANPVLVANSRFDPSTPLHGAETVDELLPNSRQLTYDGWGHVALGRTPCVDRTITDYLLGDDPGDETVCPAGPSPFDVAPPPPPASSADAGFPAELRTGVEQGETGDRRGR